MSFSVVIAQHTQETNAGLGTGLIIGILALIVLGVVVGFTLLHKGSRASKGGVEEAPGEQQRRGDPPVEGVAR